MISAPTAATERTGSCNAAMANFFRITSLNRGLRKIVQDKAQGSGREGAYFVYATERTGSCNAVMGDFSAVRSLHERHGDGFYLNGIIIHFARQAVVEIVVP